jgi:hypothetical protein
MESQTEASPSVEGDAKSELITIAGGVEVEVAFGNNGSKEKVKVRQIPISRLQDFLVAMGNEGALIEIYCDKPEGWADTLTIESANLIADKGQEINLPFLSAWWQRQAKWRKIQAQAGNEEFDKRVMQLIESRLGNSPPRSPTTTG